ncbi:glutamate 5-kinase [Tuber magnatum]|uniref:Glutamate 5-kinase n=1 Tax=Tuber magnatum TaxID=42249 RepID=A0A317SNB9_9PEZI|nr:glutamate 5-kinase [Tuber magnatum]
MNPSPEFNRFAGSLTNMKGKRALTIVIKLGTSSICDEKTHDPLLSNLSSLVETAVRLRRDGHRVILVSSGAIGIGLKRLDIEKRPKHLAAAQCRLIALWDGLFQQLRQPVAQVLLTRNDIADRTQYLNASNTFAELLSMDIIPIVNENDTLAVNEIKFGDNDTLSAITAGMVNADYLFLMTDVDCLYTNNPRTHPDAQPIEVVEDVSTLRVDVSSTGSALGTGGMATKLTAARLATSAGVTTIITRSSIPSNIFHIVAYIQSLKGAGPNSQPQTPSITGTSPTLTPTTTSSADDPMTLSPLPSTATSRSPTPQPAASLPHPLHTRFLPKPRALRDRYFWILHGLAPHGTVYIDEGAYGALTRRDKAGLLPVGVVDVAGTFAQQEAVNLAVVQRIGGGAYVVKRPEVGRALVNYSSTEIARIMGQQSSRIQELLGYAGLIRNGADSEYIAYRDNTAFFDRKAEE